MSIYNAAYQNWIVVKIEKHEHINKNISDLFTRTKLFYDVYFEQPYIHTKGKLYCLVFTMLLIKIGLSSK